MMRSWWQRAGTADFLVRRFGIVSTITVVAGLVIGGARGGSGSSTARQESSTDRDACVSWDTTMAAASSASDSMTITLSLPKDTARSVLRSADETIAKMRLAHDRRIVNAAPVLEILRHNMLATLNGGSSAAGEPTDVEARVRALETACASVAPSTSTPCYRSALSALENGAPVSGC